MLGLNRAIDPWVDMPFHLNAEAGEERQEDWVTQLLEIGSGDGKDHEGGLHLGGWEVRAEGELGATLYVF